MKYLLKGEEKKKKEEEGSGGRNQYNFSIFMFQIIY